MSLIISMNTPNCIVVASDSCMTMTTINNETKNVMSMSYTKHSPKMVVFRERLVVTYCDAMFVNETISVLQFLQNIRSSVSKNITPQNLAKLLLSEYKKQTNGGRTVFLISGYIGIKPYIYRVETNKDDIELTWEENRFGASFNGETKYVKPMLDSIASYRNLSIKDTILLVSTMMNCISNLAQFWESQTVGGDIDIYIMYQDKTIQSGWVKEGQSIPIIPYKYKQINYERKEKYIYGNENN